MKRTSNAAYPKVISNLGALSDKSETQIVLSMIRFMNHYCRNTRERKAIIEFFQADRHSTAGY